MRSLLMLLGLLLVAGCAGRGPVLSVAEPVWNVGTIITNSVHEKQVQIVNTGSAPLQIEKIEQCCGFYASMPLPVTLAPGNHTTLKLQVNPFKLVGDLHAEVNVISNDRRSPRYPLLAVGQVVPKIYALANVQERRIDLGLLEVGETVPFAVRVENPGNTELAVRALEKSAAVQEITALAAVTPGNSVIWPFRYTARGTGPIEENLVISTNDALNRAISVQLRGYVIPRTSNRHGLLIYPVGEKAIYDVNRQGYRLDFQLLNQGSSRVSIGSGPATTTGMQVQLPALLDPQEKQAGSVWLPLESSATGQAALELRLILPIPIQ